MILVATIGAKALYLLFVWLLSATVGSWLSERKGYGERVGLAFGMILSAIGLVLVLLLPGRPGSAWKEDGWLPRRRGDWAPDPGVTEGPLAVGDRDVSETGAGSEPPANRPDPAPEPPANQPDSLPEPPDTPPATG